jgi:hypothetical protein
MKIKFLSCAFLITAFACFSYAQTVKITPKKTVYTRKPDKGFEHKKNFTIIYPKVSGLSSALNKKIEKAVSFERVFDFTVQEEINEVFWLHEAVYKVDYSKNGILSIALTIDGSGAYPSQNTKHIVVNLKNGNRVKAVDAFIKLPELARFADKSLQSRIKQATAESRKESAEDAETLREMLKESKFGVENLEFFSVNDKGVTFYFDYGFPHVILALEPDNQFFFSYRQLKSFIKPSGLLNQFVR